VPRGTWDTARVSFDFDYAAITLYGLTFQTVPLSKKHPTLQSRNPYANVSLRERWRVFRFSYFEFRILIFDIRTTMNDIRVNISRSEMLA
jgi:hypothetical protein